MEGSYGYQQYREPQTNHRTRWELNHATTLRRVGAYIIDGILLFVIAFIIGFSLGFTFAPLGFTALLLPLILIEIFLSLAYFTLLESKAGGAATLGKRALGLKVVDENGREPSLGKSLGRNLARLLWEIPFFVGFIIMIIDTFLVYDSDQRIGDKLAGTYVAKEEYGSIYKQRGYTSPQPPQRSRVSQGPRPDSTSQGFSRRAPPQDQQRNPCPDCGENIRYIEENDDWYCDRCQEYKTQQRRGRQPRSETRPGIQEPHRPPSPPMEKRSRRFCPDCGRPMRYVEEQDSWWCNHCREYKL